MPSFNTPVIATEEIVRPTRVEVDLDRLEENFRALRRHVAPARVMPVLKANAYGHGLVEVARLLTGLGADYLGVAVLEEGILLRREGVDVPILVMGGIMDNQIPHFLEHRLTLAASSVPKLQQIEEAAAALGRRARVHLKIDTGMERIGVHHYSAGDLLEAALASRHCDIEGIYSHFADADGPDLEPTRAQLARFLDVVARYRSRGLALPLAHIANSAALARLPESHLDLVRPGILAYGVYPSPDVPRTVPVRPALSWKSRVVYFKVVQPGSPVSYGGTWRAPQTTRLVTVPVGYGDGYFLRLSNRSQVLIRGRRYPVVGRVCMDALMVDIGWETAYNGDEVVLLGESGGETITCEDLAGWGETIPYEVLTNINTRVPRVYLRRGEPVGV